MRKKLTYKVSKKDLDLKKSEIEFMRADLHDWRKDNELTPRQAAYMFALLLGDMQQIKK